jgi:PTS system nitrogen regulatory IIA component
MQLESIISPDLTFCNIEGVSKKRLLETSAELIASKVDINPDEVYEALITREQLGSTGLGNGIAIPHCRVPKCEKTIGCLVKLTSPIDFDSIDQKPVDLLFFLLVPENTIKGHLEVLRTLAELFKNPSYCDNLRKSQNDAELYAAAMRTPNSAEDS